MDLDAVKDRYERSQTIPTIPYPAREIEESLADIPTLIEEVESLYGLLRRIAKKRVDPPPGQELRVPSQVFISMDEETDAEVLRAEIKKLDDRLRWQYQLYGDECFLNLRVTLHLADQRDKAHRHMTRFHELLAAARTWQFNWARMTGIHADLRLVYEQKLADVVKAIDVEVPGTVERMIPVLEALAEWRDNIETYVVEGERYPVEQALLTAFTTYVEEKADA